MSKIIHKYSDLAARVRQIGTKSASSDAVSMPDSVQTVGTASVPSHPDGDNKKKQQLPPDGQNGKINPNGEANGQDPAGAQENVPTSKVEPALDPNPEKSASSLFARVQAIGKKAEELNKSAAATAAPSTETTPATTKKADNTAVDADLVFTPEMHMKLASAILENEEGVKLAYDLLARQRGKEEAHAMIKSAMTAHQSFLENEAQTAELTNLQEQIELEQMTKLAHALESVPEAEREQLIKIATVHSTALDAIENPILKCAYQQGAEDAEAMMASMGPEGQGEPSLPGAGGGAPSLEEIQQALEALIASGELTPEEAQQALTELAAQLGGAGGGAGEGAPADAGAEDPTKQAAAIIKQAAELIAA